MSWKFKLTFSTSGWATQRPSSDWESLWATARPPSRQRWTGPAFTTSFRTLSSKLSKPRSATPRGSPPRWRKPVCRSRRFNRARRNGKWRRGCPFATWRGRRWWQSRSSSSRTLASLRRRKEVCWPPKPRQPRRGVCRRSRKRGRGTKASKIPSWRALRPSRNRLGTDESFESNLLKYFEMIKIISWSSGPRPLLTTFSALRCSCLSS